MGLLVLVVALVLSSAPAAMAQNQGSGIKGGVNFAELDIDPGDFDFFERRTGLVAGAFFVLPVAPHFSIQPEALYSQKGAKVEEADGGGTLKLDYFDIPILARWDSSNSGEARFNVFAGPSFNFRIRARQDIDGENNDISADIERFDLGIVFGAGVEFGKFLIDGRSQLGLRPVNKFRDEEGFEAKNRSFSLMGGFRF